MIRHRTVAAYDRVKLDLDLPDEFAFETRERANISPIWYTPRG